MQEQDPSYGTGDGALSARNWTLLLLLATQVDKSVATPSPKSSDTKLLRCCQQQGTVWPSSTGTSLNSVSNVDDVSPADAEYSSEPMSKSPRFQIRLQTARKTTAWANGLLLQRCTPNTACLSTFIDHSSSLHSTNTYQRMSNKRLHLFATFPPRAGDTRHSCTLVYKEFHLYVLTLPK